MIAQLTLRQNCLPLLAGTATVAKVASLEQPSVRHFLAEYQLYAEKNQIIYKPRFKQELFDLP